MVEKWSKYKNVSSRREISLEWEADQIRKKRDHHENIRRQLRKKRQRQKNPKKGEGKPRKSGKIEADKEEVTLMLVLR